MATPPTSTILPWDWKGGKYSPGPYTRDSAHKTFGPTDLTSTYLVASGIEPRPSGLESDALTIRLPTARVVLSCVAVATSMVRSEYRIGQLKRCLRSSCVPGQCLHSTYDLEPSSTIFVSGITVCNT
ncbi:hypothetical protein TNCV_3246341 [Trichonephila clavipes]|nr:hypothetical protein TNCV_3246341 [Trichonephila clavipes]